MTSSLKLRSDASPDMDLEPVVAAWSELKTYLERRSQELSMEVRNYPTPIARCDEQLAKLIEQRSGAIDRLQLLLQAAPAPSDPFGHGRLGSLDAYLTRAQAFPDDEIEAALRSRLMTALSGVRGKA